jgi:hypothetical protein
MNKLSKELEKEALKISEKHFLELEAIYPTILVDLISGNILKAKSGIMAFALTLYFYEIGKIPNVSHKNN